MSTFRLRLTYSGLCFFVRDPTQAVHVLLPVTDGVPLKHNGMVMQTPRHYGRIYYDKAHLSQGQTQVSGDPPVEQLFENFALDLSNVGSGVLGGIPAQIADVDVPPGLRVAAMLHSMRPNDPGNPDPNNPNQPGDPKRVLARVTVRAGSVACMDPGVYCYYGPDPAPGASYSPVRITNRVVWVIGNVHGTSLTLPLGGLDNEPGSALPTLYPIPTSGVPTIDLLICNLVWDELPGNTPAQPAFSMGEEATHYHHFFRFYRHPGMPNVPRYFSMAGGASCSNTSFSTPGVRPFRCLLAAGTSAP
jgi:hypothetical protein